MKTFQDLEALKNDEGARAKFIADAIAEHRASGAYAIASDAERYYAKQNVTISKFQKFLYTALGEKVQDITSANYKLKTLFFRRFVIQQSQYVLANGVSFEDKDAKKKHGRNFDNAISRLAKKAMVDGVSFGFWNYDHLEVFSFADTPQEPGFVPLQDENTSQLRAGIRYWFRTDPKTSRATLYEIDGYTEYVKTEEDERYRVLQEKRTYKQTTKRTEVGGVEEQAGSNYPGFPIIPMYANDLKRSELEGIRESIDCYDFIKSGLANDIDDSNTFYWILENSGGMDDVDLQRFVERMKMLRATVLEPETKAQAHTMSIPTEARETMLNRLKADLYEDFMIVDVKALSAASKTATEIRAAYQPMDDKCGDFEFCIREFISQLQALLGIDAEPSFKYNRIANQTEETQMVMTAAEYLDDEAVLDHLSWITPEEKEAITQRKMELERKRFTPPAEEE